VPIPPVTLQPVSIYEYRTLRIERGGWPAFSASVFGACARQTAAAGGSVVALFAGMIGVANDEGVLLRAWPDDEALANHAARTLTVDALVHSHVTALAPTVRPAGEPNLTSGVYAHRWFWLRHEHEAAFADLSHQEVWPFFESDGCTIVGLWRDLAQAPLARLLLITRYGSVAHWERTRTTAPEPPPGVDPSLYARAAGGVRRRAELTQRSSVALTRLVTHSAP
jgi:hypothetical protein